MRTRALLATLTVVAMAFAGCSGDQGEDGDSSSNTSSRSTVTGVFSSSSSSSASATTTASSSSTSTGSTAPNQAPTGSISASVNGTNVTFSLTGSDPDGDTLVWELGFGDGNSTNGTVLPTNVTHAYSGAGNFTANFTITDGTDPVAYDVDLEVVGGGSGGGTFFTFSGDVATNCASQCESCDPAGAAGCLPVAAGAFGCASFNAGTTPAGNDAQGGDCIWTELPEGSAGRAFTATSTGGDPDLDFIDVCNVIDGVDTSSFWSAGPEEGVVPAGFPCLVIWEFTPVPMGSTLTFTIA